MKLPHMDLKRAQQVMKQKKVDVLIANTEDNVLYTSGYKGAMADWLPIFIIVPADPSVAPTMIVNSFVEVQVRTRCHVDDVRTYPIWMPIMKAEDLIKGTVKTTEKPVQFDLGRIFNLLSDVLKEKKLHESVIGVEKNLLKDRDTYALLTKQNPKAKFVEADDIFWEIRKVKQKKKSKHSEWLAI